MVTLHHQSFVAIIYGSLRFTCKRLMEVFKHSSLVTNAFLSTRGEVESKKRVLFSKSTRSLVVVDVVLLQRR